MSPSGAIARLLVVRTAAPQLQQAGNGSVIAIASMYGLVGQYERVAYCGAKAGMIGMVRAMALDFADKGVRVNAIAPGFIEAELSHGISAQRATGARGEKARYGSAPGPAENSATQPIRRRWRA
jgi:NAD(P)-dependent dehydrogenase (short-subunit alcohol dehydrogenase family)